LPIMKKKIFVTLGIAAAGAGAAKYAYSKKSV